MPRRSFLVAIAIDVATTATAQDTRRNVSAVLSGGEYDARQFLSATERNAFRKVYPNFDEPRAERNWQWKDIDPLGLFSAEENRRRRRELFLFEYSPSIAPSEETWTSEQQAFEAVLRKQFDDATILTGRNTLKIGVPYTERYEGKLPLRNLLEKTALLGFRWAQVGGTNLYLYNGPILMSRYKAGYVSLANRNIDQPTTRPRRSGAAKSTQLPHYPTVGNVDKADWSDLTLLVRPVSGLTPSSLSHWPEVLL